MKGPFRFVIVTLFREFFDGPLQASLLGRAIGRGDITVDMIDPRDFTTDKHRTVDDTPYGGGPGMVLKPGPMVSAIEAARELAPGASVWLLCPSGRPFSSAVVRELAGEPGMILVCGRYEGYDERIRTFVDGELSIGDYVLTGGEPAAFVVIDAVARYVPSVLGNEASTTEESFSDGFLEYPQYTRPASYRGLDVPEVLLSGHHGEIAGWRRDQALRRTQERRPDLLPEEVTDAVSDATDD